MAGFFAVDRRALPGPAVLRPIGYKIGLELMVRGRLRVGAVPIAFDDRRRGRSKLGWRQRLDYLRHLGRLYVHVAGRVLRRSRDADDRQGQAETAPAGRRRAARPQQPPRGAAAVAGPARAAGPAVRPTPLSPGRRDAAAFGPLALYAATLPRTVVLEHDGLFLMAGRAPRRRPSAGLPALHADHRGAVHGHRTGLPASAIRSVSGPGFQRAVRHLGGRRFPPPYVA